MPAKVAFSPDGSLLAIAIVNQAIRLWDVAMGEVSSTFEMQSDNRAFSIEFSPDGTILASAGGDEHAVVLWDFGSGIRPRSIPHEDQLMAIAFSPDGKLLAAGCYDYQICFMHQNVRKKQDAIICCHLPVGHTNVCRLGV